MLHNINYHDAPNYNKFTTPSYFRKSYEHTPKHFDMSQHAREVIRKERHEKIEDGTHPAIEGAQKKNVVLTNKKAGSEQKRRPDGEKEQ